MDLASLTAKVCRIAMDAGSFLKEERKTFRSERRGEETCA